MDEKKSNSDKDLSSAENSDDEITYDKELKTEPQKVKISLWEPEFKKGKHFSSLIISSRNSGKSYLCRYLLKYKLRHLYDMFIIICNNLEEREKYQDIVPTELAFSTFDGDMIKEIIAANQKRSKEGKKPINWLVLMDDSIGNKIKNDDDMLQTFATGRHFNVSIIFISQNYSLCNTIWRNNSDLIFMLKQNSSQARKAIKENIIAGSIYIEKDENKLINKVMHNYMSKVGDVLVVDYRNACSDNLFRFRAPDGLKE